MENKAFLDYLYYDVGKQQYNFFLARAYLDKEGKPKYSKWRAYLDAQSDDRFIANCNQRSILPCEVILDLESKERITPILAELKQLNLYFFAYDTGSRGYHIHLFFNRDMTTQEKLAIIRHFGADEMKASEKTLIALENATHWKSGKIKEELMI